MANRTIFPAVLIACGALGCGNSSPNASNPEVDAGADTAPVEDADAAAEVATDTAPDPWKPCAGSPDKITTCATFELPLDWSKPEGPKVPIFVKRYRPSKKPRGSIWMLAGGPGQSGASFEAIANEQAAVDPSLDIYLPDHRGTGKSGRLACPLQEAASSEGGEGITVDETPDCIAALKTKWGDGLLSFTTTNAAKDVASLIDRTRAPGDQVFVFGVSYGTYWAHRYLQVAPTQASGVIVDAICPPGECDFYRMDAWKNGAAKLLFDACGKDGTCASKLGTDPWATLGGLLDAIDAGHCKEAGVDRGLVKAIVAFFVSYGGWDARMLAPAIVHRLDRCSAGDVKALMNLSTVLSAPALFGDYSIPLQNTVSFSELVAPVAPTRSELQAIYDAAYAAPGSMVFLDLAGVWPRYPRDSFVDGFATSSTPMLMMHGTLDFIPIASAMKMKEHFSGPNQTFVALPNSPHATTRNSPVSDGGFPCATTLMRNFMSDPKKPVDTSCVAKMLPLDFSSRGPLSSYFLGTSDMWEGVPAMSATKATEAPKEARELTETWRRLVQAAPRRTAP